MPRLAHLYATHSARQQPEWGTVCTLNALGAAGAVRCVRGSAALSALGAMGTVCLARLHAGVNPSFACRLPLRMPSVSECSARPAHSSRTRASMAKGWYPFVPAAHTHTHRVSGDLSSGAREERCCTGRQPRDKQDAAAAISVGHVALNALGAVNVVCRGSVAGAVQLRAACALVGGVRAVAVEVLVARDAPAERRLHRFVHSRGLSVGACHRFAHERMPSLEHASPHGTHLPRPYTLRLQHRMPSRAHPSGASHAPPEAIHAQPRAEARGERIADREGEEARRRPPACRRAGEGEGRREKAREGERRRGKVREGMGRSMAAGLQRPAPAPRISISMESAQSGRNQGAIRATGLQQPAPRGTRHTRRVQCASS